MLSNRSIEHILDLNRAIAEGTSVTLWMDGGQTVVGTISALGLGANPTTIVDENGEETQVSETTDDSTVLLDPPAVVRLGDIESVVLHP